MSQDAADLRDRLLTLLQVEVDRLESLQKAGPVDPGRFVALADAIGNLLPRDYGQ
jgi:hypothetical protein